MYTDTHTLLLAGMAGWYYKERLTPRIACAIGAGLPDYAMLGECLIRVLNGEALYNGNHWSSFTNGYTPVAHSLFIIALVWQSVPYLRTSWFYAFMFGWVSHPVIDMLTHGRTDVPYLWPSTYPLGRLFGILDYRVPDSYFRTFWEIALDFGLTVLVFWQAWKWFTGSEWRRRHIPVLISSLVWEAMCFFKPAEQDRRI